MKCNNPDCEKELSEECNPKRKYCNQKCKDHVFYLRNKEKYIEYARRWGINNPEKKKECGKKSIDKFRKNKPERFNELMMEEYKRNPLKWRTRSETNKIRDEILKIFQNQCIQCGSDNNLEIHHLDYKWELHNKKELNLKFNIDKVKVLCRPCHRELHKSKLL